MKPKKRFRFKIIFLIFVILFLLAGSATAYAYRYTLFNTYALLTKSSTQYYAYMEKLTLEEMVDRLKPYLDISSGEAAYEVSTDITFHRETLDSVMQNTLGTSLSDMEASIGFPIENAGVNAIFAYNENQMSDTLKLRMNQADIITLKLFMDTINKEMLLHLPDLSPAYVSQTLTTNNYDTNMMMAFLELLTCDQTADLMKRYGSLIIDQIHEVELKKNVTLSLDTLSVECNELIITLSEEEISDIAAAVIEEAKNDPVILNVLPKYEITEADFVLELEGAKADLISFLYRSPSEESIQLHIYINRNGRMIGRELTLPDSQASFGYTILSKNSFDEYRISIAMNHGNRQGEQDNLSSQFTCLELNGSHTRLQDACNGAVKLEYSNPSSETTSNLVFDIAYEDVCTKVKDSLLYQYGTYTLSSPELQGIQITLENSVTDAIQNNQLVFRMGTSPFITMDFSSKFLQDYPVTMPPEAAIIYDETQLEEYQASIHLDTYLKSLAEKLGIDESILYAFFPYSNSSQ